LVLTAMPGSCLDAMLGETKEHDYGIGGTWMARELHNDDLELGERSVQANLAVMHRYFDLLYTKDLDAMLELVDDDIRWLVVPTGDVIRGKAELAELAKNHWAASPDRTKKLLTLFAVEDYACMEYASGGTLTGEVDFRSIKIPPSGLTYEIQCCFVFRFKNGRINRVHEYFDMDTVKRITRFAATSRQPQRLQEG
jgi:steroid delta-isomerase-like uncharacterized protein